MALTRFKDGRTGKDGPVSGALTVIPIGFDDVAASETVAYSWSPPTGMKYEVVDISVQCTAETGTVLLSAGTAKAGTQLVGPTAITTNLGSVTLKSNSVTAGDTLDVRLVAGGGESAESVAVTITGYVSAPPTSTTVRGISHF